MNRPADSRSLLAALEGRLFAPVDITFLVWFRVLFGAMLAWEVTLFFSNGLIDRYYIAPAFHLTYYGFDWVTPLPGTEMFLLFGLLGLAGFCVMIGLYSRLSAALFGLAFTYVFLLEKARYLNHFYLMILLCGMLAVMPSGGAFSADVLLRPGRRRSTVPAWMLWLLRFQVGVAYFYAGLAKFHPDWLSGRVIEEMMAYKQHLPIVADFGNEHWFALFLSYAGLLFDLLVTPLLLWRRTRVLAIAAATVFHLSNSVLFHIDVFPWLMLGATIILFADDWLPWRVKPSPPTAPATKERTAGSAASSWQRRATEALLAAYVCVQLALPLRHHLYPGDAAWTLEGHNFAWRMLMLVKHADPPRFPVRYVQDGKTHTSEIPVPQDPDFWRYHWQARKILLDPDMVWQVVQDHAAKLREQGAEQIDIRAIVPVSFNGYRPQLLIDPEVNLAAVPRSLRHKTWVRGFDRGAATTER